MKKRSMLIISLAMATGQLLYTATAKAQASSASGTTTLNVKLSDALSLTVNNAEVLLSFVTPADYTNGVTVAMNNHLTITSTKPYTINVKAASATLAGITTGNTNTIETNKVNVAIPDPTGQGLGGSTATVPLGLTDAALIAQATAAAGKNINVQYSIPAANTAAVIGKTPDTYSTILTYTITQ